MEQPKNSRSIRYSRQREKILDVVKQADHHPTADWVYQNVQEEFPNISLGTVYRNLHQLAAMGDIQEIVWGKEPSRFEYGSDDHPHFKCRMCGELYNLEVPISSLIIRGVEKNEGHKVENLQLLIRGICKNCHGGETE